MKIRSLIAGSLLIPAAGSILLFAVVLMPSCKEEPEPAQPNILFAIADDQSFPHAGAYGCKWVSTPGFDEIAEEGLLFYNTYTPNAKCAPSRSILLTGRYSWQLEKLGNHTPDEFPQKYKVFFDVLKEAGYHTGSTGKGWGPGNNSGRELTGTYYGRRKLDPPATGIANDDYAANFRDFLLDNPEDKPWLFWFGAREPHRGYEYGSGVAKGGRNLADIEKVPGYWPDTDTVRNDMLDYAYEVEHFDRHLALMLEMIAERGESNNTLVIVTSDHGMPFPRVKGQAYENSNHVPMAIRWPEGIASPGRKILDFVSFVDLAPTILEAAGISWENSGMLASPGKSWSDIFNSKAEGRVNPARDHVLIGKERHDVGRPNDWGYPIRGIITEDYLYIRNYETDRWPAGNPETGYLNCDGSPTKSLILNMHRNGTDPGYWDLCFGKRPDEEFYHISVDNNCLNNLAADPDSRRLMEQFRKQMIEELSDQQDPRMFGNGEVFENYPYGNSGRGYYERFMKGEAEKAGWVNAGDYE